MEKWKKIIQSFYIDDIKYKYYILFESQYNLIRLFHRNPIGSFYHAIIEDSMEDEIISYLSSFGKILDIKNIDNRYLAISVNVHDILLIFKLYPIDNRTTEVI